MNDLQHIEYQEKETIRVEGLYLQQCLIHLLYQLKVTKQRPNILFLLHNIETKVNKMSKIFKDNEHKIITNRISNNLPNLQGSNK